MNRSDRDLLDFGNSPYHSRTERKVTTLHDHISSQPTFFQIRAGTKVLTGPSNHNDPGFLIIQKFTGSLLYFFHQPIT